LARDFIDHVLVQPTQMRPALGGSIKNAAQDHGMDRVIDRVTVFGYAWPKDGIDNAPSGAQAARSRTRISGRSPQQKLRC
jgi:hypothetical protein